MEKITLLLADDHPVVRRGLVLELEQAGDLTVVAEAGSVCKAVEKCKEARPQIAVIDVQLPDGSGIEACRQIIECCPKTAVLILTSFDWDVYLAGAQAAGAAGFVVKTADMGALVQAIREVAQGKRLWTAEQRQRIQVWQEMVGKRLAQLTPREREVLLLLTAGKSNRQIAEELGVSENTVETHVQHVLNKLELDSRQGAIVFVMSKLTGKNHGFP